MFWPDRGSGVDIEPARQPVASPVRKYFTEGGVGQPPTVPGGDWFNQITNELLNVLAAAGIDASKTEDDQLLRAIRILSSDDLKFTSSSKLSDGIFNVSEMVCLSDRGYGVFVITNGGTPNGTYILDAGNGNTAVYQIPSDGVVNVKALGGKSGVDSSLAVRHACALSTSVHFPDDDVYEVSFPVGANGSFVTYTDAENVRIIGPRATIKDVNTYGVDFLTDIFKFVNCKGVYINVGCDANVLPDIAAPYPNGIGYNGSAFVYLEGFCERVVVDSIVKNVRYGIRQGGYSNPALGGANDITAKLRCFQVGYPVAFYRASNIKLDVDSNIQHRAAYITGCSNVRGTVAFAGFTYASMGVLIADAILVASAVDANRQAYGGDNIHINVVDRGSTGTQSNRAACGIAAAWKAPNTAFNDIHIHLSVKCNNANRTLAGFRLENTVGWYSTNEYNNIKVSGTIDRREQDIAASSWADFTINGIESGETGPYPNSPKFNGIDLSELQIINAAATSNNSQVFAPNAVGVVNLRGAKMAGANLSINTPNARVVLTNATIAVVAGPGIKFPALNTATNGYRVNDDGTIEQWMLVNYTATANTDQTFSWPTNFLNAARAPSLTPVGVASITATVNGLTANGITIRASVTGVSIYVRAIGY